VLAFQYYHPFIQESRPEEGIVRRAMLTTQTLAGRTEDERKNMGSGRLKILIVCQAYKHLVLLSTHFAISFSLNNQFALRRKLTRAN
jgi:hypothetical protein